MSDTEPKTRLSFRRLIVLLVLLSLLSGYGAHQLWHAQRPFNPLQLVRRPVSVQTRDDAALLSGWLDQVDNGWEVGKNHQKVKSAFAKAVSRVSRSTVRVLRQGETVAMGTVVGSEGMIVTKASEVVNAPGKLECQLFNRRKVAAEVVGQLEEYDLAMLKVAATDLRPVRWSQADPPPVGSLLATATVGRAEPLAVGIVSIAPREIARDAVLGIRLRDVKEGVIITEVLADSAADLAGLKPGDLIRQVDDTEIQRSESLVETISQHLPGDGVEIRLRRDEEEMTIEVRLGRRTELDLEYSDFQSFLGGDLSFRRTGFPPVIQHDTFLLPEHCGGPVVDLEGRVVGINIARAERIASYALPAAAILPWINQFKGDLPQETVARRE